ncbi:hypothetical protein EI94DRAFT_1731714 [Lactarius quietus]|nr:hypothetical protein EI94DRAFT_1731714 [Lactarius quietus]
MVSSIIRLKSLCVLILSSESLHSLVSQKSAQGKLLQSPLVSRTKFSDQCCCSICARVQGHENSLENFFCRALFHSIIAIALFVRIVGLVIHRKHFRSYCASRLSA